MRVVPTGAHLLEGRAGALEDVALLLEASRQIADPHLRHGAAELYPLGLAVQIERAGLHPRCPREIGAAEFEGGIAVNHCMRHYEEPLMAYCRTCRNPFCNRCLVYAYGPTKPPYCVGCALFASGVRNGNNRVPAPPATITEASDLPAAGGAPAPLVMETSPTMDRRAERAYKRAEKAA